jgi:hypothetical protein
VSDTTADFSDPQCGTVDPPRRNRIKVSCSERTTRGLRIWSERNGRCPLCGGGPHRPRSGSQASPLRGGAMRYPSWGKSGYRSTRSRNSAFRRGPSRALAIGSRIAGCILRSAIDGGEPGCGVGLDLVSGGLVGGGGRRGDDVEVACELLVDAVVRADKGSSVCGCSRPGSRTWCATVATSPQPGYTFSSSVAGCADPAVGGRRHPGVHPKPSAGSRCYEEVPAQGRPRPPIPGGRRLISARRFDPQRRRHPTQSAGYPTDVSAGGTTLGSKTRRSHPSQVMTALGGRGGLFGHRPARPNARDRASLGLP